MAVVALNNMASYFILAKCESLIDAWNGGDIQSHHCERALLL